MLKSIKFIIALQIILLSYYSLLFIIVTIYFFIFRYLALF